MAALILIYVDLNVIHRILVLTRMFGSRHNVTLIGDMIERFWYLQVLHGLELQIPGNFFNIRNDGHIWF